MLTEAKWKVLERQIIRRDHSACKAVCGCTTNLTVHHIIPRVEGGSDDPLNLVTLCKFCHDEIEDTDIRTLARIRIFIPHWHEAVSWYETAPQCKTRIGKTIRKPKPSPRIAKPRGIHLNLDTHHIPDVDLLPKPKIKRAVKPEREITPVIIPVRLKPYINPDITEADNHWLHCQIMYGLLETEGFDPAEINQTPEAWELLTHWWMTGNQVSLAKQKILGIDECSPIYDDFDGEYFRPRISDDPEEAIPYLRFLIERAEYERIPQLRALLADAEAAPTSFAVWLERDDPEDYEPEAIHV